MKPGIVAILLFLSLCLSVLVLAFVSQFYHRFYYQQFGENEQQADAARAHAAERYQDMFNGLKSTIAFSFFMIIFNVIALVAIVLRSKRLTRVTGFLIIFFSIGLVVSVGVWVGGDKARDYEDRFHAEMKNFDKYLKDNNADIPNYVHTWRNSYYGTIVCMVFSVFFGIVGSSLLCRLIE